MLGQGSAPTLEGSNTGRLPLFLVRTVLQSFEESHPVSHAFQQPHAAAAQGHSGGYYADDT